MNRPIFFFALTLLPCSLAVSQTANTNSTDTESANVVTFQPDNPNLLQKTTWKDRSGNDFPNRMSVVDYLSTPLTLTQRRGVLFVNKNSSKTMSAENLSLVETIASSSLAELVDQLLMKKGKPMTLTMDVVVLKQINDFSEVAAKGVQVATDREDAEEGTAIDVLQSQTLLSEVTLAAERAEVACRGTWQDLAAIVGLSAATPARLAAEFNLPEVSPNWDAAYSEIVSQCPEMSVARALVCEKQAMLKRQQVQIIPNVTGQLGVGYDDATNSGMLNLQVGAPIPVWNKDFGNISAAFADYNQAVQNVKRIEQAIKARLARAAQEYDASLASVRKYQSQILPQTETSLALSEQAYRVGELNFLQVLVVRRSYYESRIQLIAVQGQLAQASAKVDGLLLIGGLDAPVDFTNGDGIRGQAFSGL